MLSVLIPIYNQDVRKLVYALANQCTKAGIPFQILCFDDGSLPKYKEKNKELAFKMNINYTELPENLGRSRIRNWLGKAAYFEYLLFLDGDSGVRDKHFIKNYLSGLPYEGVVYGGRSYQKKKPANPKKILHWKYGMRRESLSAKSRNKQPYLNFQSNNFLVPAKVFEKVHFQENVDGYGYEDLQYALQLQKVGIPIKHIQNPIFHDGLETNVQFIQKTKKSIENLIFLEKKKQIPKTRLQDFNDKLKYFGLQSFVFFLLQKSAPMIEKNLMSSRPSVILFNLWKLFIYLDKTQKK